MASRVLSPCSSDATTSCPSSRTRCSRRIAATAASCCSRARRGSGRRVSPPSSSGGRASSAGRCSGAAAPRPRCRSRTSRSSRRSATTSTIGTRLDPRRARVDGRRAGPGLPAARRGPVDPRHGDPAQAKLRLFESVVGVLELWARATRCSSLDDIHWADSSTRELLDYAARAPGEEPRSCSARTAATSSTAAPAAADASGVAARPARRDGRRSAPCRPAVAEMIASIFDADEVSDEFRDLVAARTEGNPFVVEEMLREAIERGDIYQSDGGWERRAARHLRDARDRARHDPAPRRPPRAEARRGAAGSGRPRSHVRPRPARRGGGGRRGLRARALEEAVSEQLLVEDTGRSLHVAARADAGGGLHRHGLAEAAAAPRARRRRAPARPEAARWSSPAICWRPGAPRRPSTRACALPTRQSGPSPSPRRPTCSSTSCHTCPIHTIAQCCSTGWAVSAGSAANPRPPSSCFWRRFRTSTTSDS